jgi:hypothetical protein
VDNKPAQQAKDPSANRLQNLHYNGVIIHVHYHINPITKGKASKVITFFTLIIVIITRLEFFSHTLVAKNIEYKNKYNVREYQAYIILNTYRHYVNRRWSTKI